VRTQIGIDDEYPHEPARAARKAITTQFQVRCSAWVIWLGTGFREEA
jgi:hypothetical protein